MKNQNKKEDPPSIVKVSSNDSIPLIYFPKKIRESFGLKKGDYFAIFMDSTEKRLILQKVELPMTKLSKRGREE